MARYTGSTTDADIAQATGYLEAKSAILAGMKAVFRELTCASPVPQRWLGQHPYPIPRDCRSHQPPAGRDRLHSSSVAP